MSDMPNKIYLSPQFGGTVGFETFPGSVEYIPADLVPQWMPIETAPRDGTKCLFLTAEPEQGSPAYNMKEGRIFSGKWSDHDFILEGAYTRKPTHWMPLPRGPHD